MRAPRYGPVAVALAAMVAMAVSMGIGRFAFTPIVPMMHDDAGLGLAAAGWLATANYAGYLAGALTATALPTRSVDAIRLGLFATAITTFAMALEASFTAWVVTRFAAGVASAWVLVHASAWSLSRLAELRRPSLSGLVFAGVGAGIVLAGLICAALTHWGGASVLAWVTLGIAALLLTLLVLPVCAEASEPTPPAPRADAQPPGATSAEPYRAASVEPHRASSSVLRIRAVPGIPGIDLATLGVVLCYAAFGLGYIIPATFLPVMARNAVASPAVFVWAWPLFGFAAFVSALFAGRLARRYTPRRIWAGASLAMAIGLALPALVENRFTIFAAALLVGGTFMVIVQAAMQEGHRIGGRDRTRLIAAMTAAFAVGQMAGPPLAAAARGTSGFAPALFVASLLLAASAWYLASTDAQDRADAAG